MTESNKDYVRVHKIGDAKNPATVEDIDQAISDCIKIKQSDTELLDWLEKNTRGYGKGWICRDSTTGRGLRLHETSDYGASPTVRRAIVDAMRRKG